MLLNVTLIMLLNFTSSLFFVSNEKQVLYLKQCYISEEKTNVISENLIIYYIKK